MRTTAEEKLVRMEQKKEKIDNLLKFNETIKSASSFNSFDNMCKNAFKSNVVEFNDHNKPIIERECFDVNVEAAEWCFPRLWVHMCNLRNVQGGRSKAEKKECKLKSVRSCYKFLHYGA